MPRTCRAHASLGIDPAEAPADASLHEALALISQAQRPVIYGGGGIALGDAVQAFRTFVDATQIPTVLTLKGLGALPTAASAAISACWACTAAAPPTWRCRTPTC